MTGETPSAVVALVGVTALRLSLTDAYLNFVKPSLRLWLVVAGVLLVVLGGRGLWLAARGRRTESAPPVAWLLVLPVLAVFLVAPAPLGSFSADRNPARFAAPRASFPKLAEGDPVPMSLTEFTLRSLYDEDRMLDGHQVRLTGFVSREKGGAVYLTRFVLSCCAADARSVRVALPVRPDLPGDDTWIEAVGRW